MLQHTQPRHEHHVNLIHPDQWNIEHVHTIQTLQHSVCAPKNCKSEKTTRRVQLMPLYTLAVYFNVLRVFFMVLTGITHTHTPRASRHLFISPLALAALSLCVALLIQFVVFVQLPPFSGYVALVPGKSVRFGSGCHATSTWILFKCGAVAAPACVRVFARAPAFTMRISHTASLNPFRNTKWRANDARASHSCCHCCCLCAVVTFEYISF